MIDKITVDPIPVALYNLSIEDIKLRREKRLIFHSMTAAANFLGYTPNKLSERIKYKHRVYHRENKTPYAVRIHKIEPDEQ